MRHRPSGRWGRAMTVPHRTWSAFRGSHSLHMPTGWHVCTCQYMFIGMQGCAHSAGVQLTASAAAGESRSHCSGLEKFTSMSCTALMPSSHRCLLWNLISLLCHGGWWAMVCASRPYICTWQVWQSLLSLMCSVL